MRDSASCDDQKFTTTNSPLRLLSVTFLSLSAKEKLGANAPAFEQRRKHC